MMRVRVDLHTGYATKRSLQPSPNALIGVPIAETFRGARRWTQLVVQTLALSLGPKASHPHAS